MLSSPFFGPKYLKIPTGVPLDWVSGALSLTLGVSWAPKCAFVDFLAPKFQSDSSPQAVREAVNFAAQKHHFLLD